MAMQLEAAEAAAGTSATARAARAAADMLGGGARAAQAGRIGHPVALGPAESCKWDRIEDMVERSSTLAAQRTWWGELGNGDRIGAVSFEIFNARFTAHIQSRAHQSPANSIFQGVLGRARGWQRAPQNAFLEMEAMRIGCVYGLSGPRAPLGRLEQ